MAGAEGAGAYASRIQVPDVQWPRHDARHRPRAEGRYARADPYIDAGIAYGPWISVEALLAPIIGGIGISGVLPAHDGQIAKVFYPVFPPDRNADTVLTWLRTEARR